MAHYWRAFALAFIAIVNLKLGAAEPIAAPEDGVLLLRNGFVLQGRITHLHDAYIVSTGRDSEARLPASAVELQCRNLDEAYHIKRKALSSDLNARIDLAEWCLRHGLTARAADQWLAVFAQQPAHPRLAGLENRIMAFAATQASPTASKSPSKSIERRDEPTIDLPPHLIQQFTTFVQPILFNRCATQACHGSGSTASFRLIRPTQGRVATSRLTHRNLQATWDFVNGKQPEESPLLSKASQAHGGSTRAIFDERNLHQLHLLSVWVRRAAVGSTELLAARNQSPRRVLDPLNRPSAPVTPAAFEEPAMAQPTKPEGPTSPDVLPEHDPFDPEVFNRRFHHSPDEAPAKP